MERFITDERTGIKYELIGDYYLPLLKTPECPPIGRYGKLRHRHLKQNRRVLYSQLLTSGKLGTHLAEIDNSANDMKALLVKQMAEEQGVTEQLKAID